MLNCASAQMRKCASRSERQGTIDDAHANWQSATSGAQQSGASSETGLSRTAVSVATPSRALRRFAPSFVWAIATVLTTSACTTPPQAPLRLAERVDLPCVLGDWYIVATIPNWFEKGMIAPIDSFSLRADGDIQENFESQWHSFASTRRHYTGKISILPSIVVNGILAALLLCTLLFMPRWVGLHFLVLPPSSQDTRGMWVMLFLVGAGLGKWFRWSRWRRSQDFV